VDIVFDPAKSERNRALRGFGFEIAVDFDWHAALIAEDTRRTYGEHRYIAVGPIDVTLHVLVFTLRGDTLRVISLRRANARERRLYAQTQT
jgi:uncharacterized protein